MDEIKTRVKEMATRFQNLVDETTILKPIIETFGYMRIGLRHYPDCKGLDEILEKSQTLAEQRLAEIVVSLKDMEAESKEITTFAKETPLGGIQ